MQNEVVKILKEVVTICNKNDITYYCQAGTVLGVIRHQGPIPWDYDADIIVPNNQIDSLVDKLARELPSKYFVDYFKINKNSLRQFPRVGLSGHTTDSLHLDIFRLIGLPDDKVSQIGMVDEARYYSAKNKSKRNTLWKMFFKLNFRGCLDKLSIIKYRREYFLEKFDELCNRFDFDKSKYVMNPSGKYGIKNIFEKSIYGEGVLKKFLDFEVKIPTHYDFYLRQYYNDYMILPEKSIIEEEMNKKFKI